MSDLLQEGLQLMALGMGTVFGFLVLLIVSILVMSTVIRRYSQPEIVVQGDNGRGGAQLEQIAAVAAAAKAAHNR